MKHFFFFICLFLSVSLFSQNAISVSSKLDPYALLEKVIKYSGMVQFNGSCQVGQVLGESFFDFSQLSRRSATLLVTYSVLGKMAREGGALKNLRYINEGNFNTKIIRAEWENFEGYGSGIFKMSVLDERSPNKFYVGIEGNNWKYYINIQLEPSQFQDIINQLTYKGNPWNFQREQFVKDSTIKAEFDKEVRRKAYTDSLNMVKKKYTDSIAKVERYRREDSLVNVEKQKRENIINSLHLYDYFENGYVIDIKEVGNEKSVLLMRNTLYIISPNDLIKEYDRHFNFNDGWRIPTIDEMNHIKALNTKRNKEFKAILNKSGKNIFTDGEVSRAWLALAEKSIIPTRNNLWIVFPSKASAIKLDHPFNRIFNQKSQPDPIFLEPYFKASYWLRLVKEF